MTRPPSIHSLGYREPSPARGRMLFSFSVFVTTASLLVLYAGFFLIVVPQMQRLYADFKVGLPGFTALFLGMARWMNPWGLVALALVPFALAVIVPLMLPSPTVDEPLADVRAARRWALLIRILLLLLLGAMAAAMFIPMLSLIDSITTVKK